MTVTLFVAILPIRGKTAGSNSLYCTPQMLLQSVLYSTEHRPPCQGSLHSDHIVGACPKQLGDARVQLIPVPLHKPIRVVFDCVVVVVHGKVLQS